MARLLVVVSKYLVLRSVSRSMWLWVVLRLPSIIAHELSHLLPGVLLQAKPVGMSFWPRRVAGTNQYITGHMAFQNLTFWKTLPVATAPLMILLPMGCWLIGVSLSRAYSQFITFLFRFGAFAMLHGLLAKFARLGIGASRASCPAGFVALAVQAKDGVMLTA